MWWVPTSTSSSHLGGQLFPSDGFDDRRVRRADQRSLILRCKTGISRIDLDQLLYCEVLGRTAGCH